ncbi:MAG: tRNA threonylcarbamoyladenosine dehydratase [Deltaproteobacteria bacterium]|nr:tRNA threonylcarbamoyladenosine dehydratase [Deltaproteobacteria bacterium]
MDATATANLPPQPPTARKLAKARPAQRRFDRLVRLVSVPGFRRLEDAHVIVFGVGGVGGYAAEGLARSGVGRLTLVDYDVVCATNLNRQIQALATNVGKPKAQALAERLVAINPQCAVRVENAFYGADTADRLLPATPAPDFVVDAIDNVTAKLHLIDRCRSFGFPVVSSMGAAGKLDPTLVRVADLYQTHTDPLARAVRKALRKHYGWPSGGADSRAAGSGVPVVYSLESRRKPIAPDWDAEHGFQCICPPNEAEVHQCDHRNLVEGSAVFVTSVFGMTLAGVVVRAIVGDLAAPTLAERPRP